MRSLLDHVCNDILLIVHRILHRSQLEECFQEINKRLEWNDVRQYYKNKGGQQTYPVANWRRPTNPYNRYIYSMWHSNIIERGDLPKNYFTELKDE